MGNAPTDRIPSSPHSPSPLPLPLVLLASDFSNPHLINKHQKITASRALSRVERGWVDSFDAFQKDIFQPTIVQKSDKAEMKIDDDGDVKQHADDTVTFRSVGESVRQILGYGCDMMNTKLDELKSLVSERTIWSVGAAALFLGMVMYVRKRDKSERQLLMMLLEEKDQRIANMLQQIALINDIRNLNSRIPAIRR